MIAHTVVYIVLSALSLIAVQAMSQPVYKEDKQPQPTESAPETPG